MRLLRLLLDIDRSIDINLSIDTDRSVNTALALCFS